MKSLIPLPWSLTVLLACCALQSACAEPPPANATIYDFDWRLSGATGLRPYQVFDDGHKLYLQFDDPKRVPAILADTPAGPVLLRWHPDPPYVVVDQMENALVFRMAGLEARAVRAAPDGSPRMARFGAALPADVAPATSSPTVSTTPPRRPDPLSQDR